MEELKKMLIIPAFIFIALGMFCYWHGQYGKMYFIRYGEPIPERIETTATKIQALTDEIIALRTEIKEIKNR